MRSVTPSGCGGETSFAEQRADLHEEKFDVEWLRTDVDAQLVEPHPMV